MFPESRTSLIVALASLCAAGCLADGSKPNPNVTPPSPDAGPGPEVFTASRKSKVRFKRTYRIRESLARALELDRDTLCVEVGGTSCFELHEVGLGGVEPYDLTIYEPSETVGVSAAIAADRVVLSACKARVDQDLTDLSDALLLDGLEIDGDGGLDDPTSPSTRAVVDTMYRRLLSRKASASEVDAIVAFYSEVSGGMSTRPARDWALLSCYAVGTSLEWLFY